MYGVRVSFGKTYDERTQGPPFYSHLFDGICFLLLFFRRILKKYILICVHKKNNTIEVKLYGAKCEPLMECVHIDQMCNSKRPLFPILRTSCQFDKS